ncbi:MAG: YbaK/EbsC family protein [Chloroflexota bacterium]
MQALTPNDVKVALKEHGIDSEFIVAEGSTATAEMAAEQLGCTVGQIAKSLCFVLKKTGAPVLVVASGETTVDDRKLSSLLGVGRKQVRMARAEQCIELFGYAPGGVPPVGHRRDDVQIFLDEALRQYDSVYAAAGSSSVNFGITPDDLAQVTAGTWVDVAK